MERNLKNLNFKKEEQSLREADLVKMTKKCKIKTNELKKKEDYLRLKQKKVLEGDEYWRKKKDKIRE